MWNVYVLPPVLNTSNLCCSFLHYLPSSKKRKEKWLLCLWLFCSSFASWHFSLNFTAILTGERFASFFCHLCQGERWTAVTSDISVSLYPSKQTQTSHTSHQPLQVAIAIRWWGIVIEWCMCCDCHHVLQWFWPPTCCSYCYFWWMLSFIS